MQNKMKFSSNIHYFSLNYAFFKNTIKFLAEILQLGYVSTCYA